MDFLFADLNSNFSSGLSKENEKTHRSTLSLGRLFKKQIIFEINACSMILDIISSEDEVRVPCLDSNNGQVKTNPSSNTF